MRFGKLLREKTIKDWRFYSVDYKSLKQTLKAEDNDTVPEGGVTEFNKLIDASLDKITKFYMEKEHWAENYIDVLEAHLHKLRESASAPPSPSSVTEAGSTEDDTDSVSTASSADGECIEPFYEEEKTSTGEYSFVLDSPISSNNKKGRSMNQSDFIKEQYRRVGRSTHFHHYIYAKKSLCTFERELVLLVEFFRLNSTAFSKIFKKFDKRTGSCTREQQLVRMRETHPFLDGSVFSNMMKQVKEMLEEVNTLKPSLPSGWEDRKVYTIGCFDLFHRGHQNVLMSLREFGYFIVAGIHDDESYFKLKNKYTIDNLETRMKNVKPFVDQLFVIPHTDPLLYVKSMVSEQDIEQGSCCYARGDDMLKFPGREWIESVMPVHFLPRTESCSSSLLRTMYHAEDESVRAKAAFAKTTSDGKPVDDDGNVLK